MPSPATAHNTTESHQEEASSPQHGNAFIMQPDYLAGSNGLEMHHVKNIVKNERISIQVSASGWIVFAAISLMKFMGKSTGTEVDIQYLE